jgi:phosphoribosylformylglycinamidine cyclo-ligase
VDIARVLPAVCGARVHALALERPVPARWLVGTGEVPEGGTRATRNLGIGTVVVCAPDETDRLARDLVRAGERVFPLGPVLAGERSVERTVDLGP